MSYIHIYAPEKHAEAMRESRPPGQEWTPDDVWTTGMDYHEGWCPYCDEIVEWSIYIFGDEFQCLKCKGRFPPHTFPKGLDPMTGELKETK